MNRDLTSAQLVHVSLHLVVFGRVGLTAIQVGDVEEYTKDNASQSYSDVPVKDFLLAISEFWLGLRFWGRGIHWPVLSSLRIYIAYISI